MATRRTAKAARAIREIISSAILLELNDPRVKNVTVLDVEVAADMRSAKVYVSIMGSQKEQSLCLRGLESSKGYLQKKIAERLTTRYIPVLTFVLDDSVKKSIEASRILKQLAEDRNRATEAPEQNDSTQQQEEQSD